MEPDSVHSGSELERRYRRLLRVFPRGYRAQRGDEMLATLLESAAPGQRRPDRADTVDILSCALRERLGLNAVPGFAAGLRIAGPMNLALAAGVALTEWLPAVRTVESMVVGAAWVVAVAVYVVAPNWRAAAVLCAWLVTLGGSFATGLTGGSSWWGDPYHHGAEIAFLAELTCGLIALLAAATVHSRPSWPHRIAVAGAAVGILLLNVTRINVIPLNAGPVRYIVFPSWSSVLVALPIVLALIGVAMAVARRSTGGLWAALLAVVSVSVTAGPMVTYVTTSFTGAGDLLNLPGSYPVGLPQPTDPQWWAEQLGYSSQWGLLLPLRGAGGAAALIGMLVVVAVSVAAAHRGPNGRPGAPTGLARLSGIALGAAGGISLYLLIGGAVRGGASPRDTVIAAAPLVAAIGATFAPVWLRRPLILAALAVILVLTDTGHLGGRHSNLAVILLLVVAAASVRAPAAVIGGGVLGSAGLLGIAAWFSVAGAFDLPYGPIQDTALPGVAATVLLVAPFAGIVAVLRHRGSWISGALVFTAGAFWILVQVQVVADLLLLLTLVGTSVSALLVARVVQRPPAPAVS